MPLGRGHGQALNAAIVGGEPLSVGVVVRELPDGHRFYDHFILPKENPAGISGAATPEKGKLGVQPAAGSGRSLSKNLPDEQQRSAAPGVSANRVIGRAGRMPNSAQDIELRPNEDGTLTPWSDGYELLDFDSGEPIVVPADTTDEAAIDAIKAAGALGRGVKIYASKPTQDDAQFSIAAGTADEGDYSALPIFSRAPRDGGSGGIGGGFGVIGIGEKPSAVFRPNRATISAVDLNEVIDVNLDGWRGIGLDSIVPVDHWTALPQQILDDAKKKGSHAAAVEGVVYRGKVYLVRSNLRDRAHAERVLFHEVLGHVGVRRLLSGRPTETMNQLWDKLNGLAGIAKMAKKHQVGDGYTAWDRLQPYVQMATKDQVDRRAKIVEELIAFLAQANDTSALTQFKGYLADLKAAVVALARKLGLDGLADRLDRAGGELDALQLVRDARLAIERGTTRDGQEFVLVSRQPTAAFSQDPQSGKMVPDSAANAQGGTQDDERAADAGRDPGAEAGRQAGQPEDRPVVAGPSRTDPIDSPEFIRWYGDWRVGRERLEGDVAAGDRGAAALHHVQRRRNVDEDTGAPAPSPWIGETAFPGTSGPLGRDLRPAVLFHGTRDDFTAFDLNHPNRKDAGWLGRGVYLSSSPDQADVYADIKRGTDAPRLMPLYAAVKNPYVATLAHKRRIRDGGQAAADKFTADLKAAGHDGVVMALPDGIRDFAMPFFSYTYKATPMLLQTALATPHRLIAPAGVLWGLNALSYALQAGDDDEDWSEKIWKYLTDPEREKAADAVEDDERRYLPPWLKGRTALGSPKAVRMWEDQVTGLPMFWDVSRIIPGGDLFDVSPNVDGALPLPAPITPSHPLFSIMSAFIANRDLFSGKDLVDMNDTSEEAAKKRAEWIWTQMAPAIAIGSYHWTRSMNAAAYASGEAIDAWPFEYGGFGKDGLPVQPGLAALQTIGIKLRPVDISTAKEIEDGQRSKLVRSIDAELRQLRRLHERKAVTDGQLEAATSIANLKKERLRSGKTVDGDSLDDQDEAE